MKVRIHVTADDIRRGCRKDEFACPIARAAKRAFGHRASVYETTLAMARRDDEARYQLPTRAKRFVKAFDAGERVRPFTFTINTF